MMTRLAVRLGLRRAALCAVALLIAVGMLARCPRAVEIAAVGRGHPEVAGSAFEDAARIEVVPDLGLTSPPRAIERIADVERVIAGSLRAEISSGHAMLAGDRFA